MDDLNRLTQRVAEHLAGRPVVIRWQNPVSSTAAGQTYKAPDGRIVIDIGNLIDPESRLRVLLHELSHARHDYAWIPPSLDHQQPSGSHRQTSSARQSWKANPRELRAQRQADEWLAYAEKNAWKYANWTGRTEMECRLLALLDWHE